MSKQRKHLKAKNMGKGSGGAFKMTRKDGAARTAKPEKDFAEKIAENPLYMFAYTGILFVVMLALKLILG